MNPKLANMFDHIGNFLTSSDHIACCDSKIITSIEKDLAAATKDVTAKEKEDLLVRLSWALVHSKRPKDVQKGIAMLEASQPKTSSQSQKREELYLLAVGYFRSGDIAKSRQLVEQCLEISPDWRLALILKKDVENRIANGNKNSAIGIGMTVATAGLLIGGIAAGMARKK